MEISNCCGEEIATETDVCPECREHCDKVEICCFCGEEINGWGNNALPLKEDRCCDECNISKVIPERMAKLKKEALS